MTKLITNIKHYNSFSSDYSVLILVPNHASCGTEHEGWDVFNRVSVTLADSAYHDHSWKSLRHVLYQFALHNC